MLSSIALLVFHLLSLPGAAETDGAVSRASHAEENPYCDRYMIQTMQLRRDRIAQAVDTFAACARKTSNSIDRRIAMEGLANVSSVSTRAATELASYVNDPDRGTRLEALELFANTGSTAAYARSELENRLKLGDSQERTIIAKVFGGMELSNEDTIKTISQIAGSGDSGWVYGIIAAYSGIRSAEVEQGLLEGLRHREYGIRLAAAQALGHYRPLAPKLQEMLLKQFDESARSERDYAWLQRWVTLYDLIASPNSPPGQSFRRYVKPKCESYSLLAATRISNASYLDRLLALVQAHDDCGPEAIQVIGSMGPAAERAIPIILSNIHDRMSGTPFFRFPEFASSSMVEIGTAAVPGLIQMSGESDQFRRRWAFDVLYSLADRDSRAANVVFDEMSKPKSSILYRWHLKESLKRATRAHAKTLFAPYQQSQYVPGPLLQVLPVDPYELFDLQTSTEIRVTLTASKKRLSASQRIDLGVRISNLSNRKQRVLIPSCALEHSDPINILVFQNPGWLLARRGSGGVSDLSQPEPNGSETMELSPRESKQFSCNLQDPTEKWFGKGFDYKDIGIVTDKSHQLLPGKYRIWARYEVDDKILSSPLFWSRALTEKFGRPWTGAVYSNELDIEVK
jgi:HEAT repeat protein